MAEPDITGSSPVRSPLQEFRNVGDGKQQNDMPRSTLKTASKAKRVVVESSGEATEAATSPLYKILRNGKRILQTPAARRAARVAVDAPPTTSKKASRVPLEQDAGEEFSEKLEGKDDVATDAAPACEETFGTAFGATDVQADSSWLVSSEMLPITASETKEQAATATGREIPDAGKAMIDFDAFIVEVEKAGVVTKGSATTYISDTHAVAAAHGLVNTYTPLPARTPQNTPAVKEQHTPPPKLQLTRMSPEVDDAASPPSSLRVHPSSHALDDSFSLGCSPAPTAPSPESAPSGTPALWQHGKDTPEDRMLSTSSAEEAGEYVTVPKRLQLDAGQTAPASSEAVVHSTPPSAATVAFSSAPLDDCTPNHGRPQLSEAADVAGSFITPEAQPASRPTEESNALLDAEQVPEQEDEALVSVGDASAAAYIPREKATPYLQRKLRDIKAKEWSADDTVKVHKSNLERMKEAAAAARKKSKSSAEKSLTHKLVQQAVGKAVRTEGKGLGESLVKHKSRLEKEKETAAELARAGSSGQTAMPKKDVSFSSVEGKGLSAMKVHKSRLEREREEAAERRAAGSGEEKPLPSYMRATKASIAMKKEGGLGEDLKVHKSQLERDRDAAIAAQAARKKAGVNPPTPFPHKAKRSEAASAAAQAAFGGQGLGNLPVHKSALEREKEAAAKSGASRAPRPPVARSASVAAGSGLEDMKVHKSRLQKDQEAWVKAAAEHAARGKAKSASSTPRQPAASFMRPTEAFKNKAGAATPSKEQEGFSTFVPN